MMFFLLVVCPIIYVFIARCVYVCMSKLNRNNRSTLFYILTVSNIDDTDEEYFEGIGLISIFWIFYPICVIASPILMFLWKLPEKVFK